MFSWGVSSPKREAGGLREASATFTRRVPMAPSVPGASAATGVPRHRLGRRHISLAGSGRRWWCALLQAFVHAC